MRLLEMAQAAMFLRHSYEMNTHCKCRINYVSFQSNSTIFLINVDLVLTVFLRLDVVLVDRLYEHGHVDRTVYRIDRLVVGMGLVVVDTAMDSQQVQVERHPLTQLMHHLHLALLIGPSILVFLVYPTINKHK